MADQLDWIKSSKLSDSLRSQVLEFVNCSTCRPRDFDIILRLNTTISVFRKSMGGHHLTYHPKSNLLRGRVSLATLKQLTKHTMVVSITTPQIPQQAVPINDDFNNAIVITQLPFADTTNTENATTAKDDPACAGNAHTVWYRYTPTQDQVIEANTFGSDYDTTLSVYTGTQGSLSQIVCNDDAGDTLQSQISINVVAGETFHFMVGSFGSTNGGNLVFRVQESVPAPTVPCVNVCVFVAPGSDVSNDRINRDFEEANRLWQGICGITIQRKSMMEISGPNFTFEDREIPCPPFDENGFFTSAKVEALFNFRPGCSDTELAVYYVGGNTFADGFASGCGFFTIHFPDSTSDPILRRAIILTNNARFSPVVFAHELGHVLFARPDGTADDPDPNRDPNDPIHNLNPNNLMHVPVPNNPTITPPQCQRAMESSLIMRCPAAINRI